jgi:hypothetical protein
MIFMTRGILLGEFLSACSTMMMHNVILRLIQQTEPSGTSQGYDSSRYSDYNFVNNLNH